MFGQSNEMSQVLQKYIAKPKSSCNEDKKKTEMKIIFIFWPKATFLMFLGSSNFLKPMITNAAQIWFNCGTWT